LIYRILIENGSAILSGAGELAWNGLLRGGLEDVHAPWTPTHSTCGKVLAFGGMMTRRQSGAVWETAFWFLRVRMPLMAPNLDPNGRPGAMPSDSNQRLALAALGEVARLVPAYLALSVPDVEAGDMELDPASPCVNALHHQLGFGHDLPATITGFALARTTPDARDVALGQTQEMSRSLLNLRAE
jgi:hypothetical protein